MTVSTYACWAVATAVLVTGCAQTGGAPVSAQQGADRACFFFVQEEGLRPLEVVGREQAGSQFVVNVRAEDKMSRKLTTSCRYDPATKTTNWATPLPANIAR